MEKNDADEAARMAKRITDKHLLRRNKEAKIVSYVCFMWWQNSLL